MILVTVGMQLGFDRLIEAMDELAPELAMSVFAQTGMGTFAPVHMDSKRKIAPAEFEKLVEQARLIVSHAGIGTVLTAARFRKPIVLVPRRASLGEHRNDHQIATVKKLGERPGILVALDTKELAPRIEEALQLGDVYSQHSATSKKLHEAVKNFIENGHL